MFRGNATQVFLLYVSLLWLYSAVHFPLQCVMTCDVYIWLFCKLCPWICGERLFSALLVLRSLTVSSYSFFNVRCWWFFLMGLQTQAFIKLWKPLTKLMEVFSFHLWGEIPYLLFMSNINIKASSWLLICGWIFCWMLHSQMTVHSHGRLMLYQLFLAEVELNPDFIHFLKGFSIIAANISYQSLATVSRSSLSLF